MICAAFPDDSACYAFWSPAGPDAVKLVVSGGPNHFEGIFARTDTGLAAEQKFFELQETRRGQGHGRRLARNLAHLYDRLGITHISTYANYTNGGYTWAALGAIALDPGYQRTELTKLLQRAVADGDVPAEYQTLVQELIDSASDKHLMWHFGELETAEGLEIGKIMLLQHGWSAYWDLSDDEAREYLKDALQ